MSLYEHIQSDRKHAFKAKDSLKKDILSFVIAQIKQKQIDEKKILSDDAVIKIIQKEIKSRREAVVLFSEVGNAEEKLLEEQRIAILETYLPQMLTEIELRAIVEEKADSLGIAHDDIAANKGKLIGPIMKEYGASVDGGLLQSIITTYSG